MLRSLHSMATGSTQPGNRMDRLARDDERWVVVEELLASPYFSRSPRLSSFLLYICEQSLDGRTGELNERAIGMHVFGRLPTYNPGDDSIVRSQARLLRGRLEQFFAAEGKDSAWCVTVPKGSYVPVFARREAAVADEDYVLPALETQRVRHPGWWRVAAVGCCVLVLLLVGFRFLRAGRAADRPLGQLWSAVFVPDRPTILVPADSTLSVIEGRSTSPALLSDYLKHKYPDLAPGAPLRMNDFQLTSIADLKMAVRVAQLPQAAQGRLAVKYPRDVTVHDARESNLILIGGIRANPWVQLFTSQLHFQIEADRVLDTVARAGEPDSYSLQLDSASPRSFGIIAWLGGLAGGHTLLVEGSDMAGTEAAGEFLFDEGAFDAFAERLGAGRGPLPHFELLLATTTLNGNASHFQIVAYHRIP